MSRSPARGCVQGTTSSDATVDRALKYKSCTLRVRLYYCVL